MWDDANVWGKIWQHPKTSSQGNGEKWLLKVIVGKGFWLVFYSEVLNKLWQLSNKVICFILHNEKIYF